MFPIPQRPEVARYRMLHQLVFMRKVIMVTEEVQEAHGLKLLVLRQLNERAISLSRFSWKILVRGPIRGFYY
jgi:hypothetical protein